jgi:hypothetical protein
MATLPEPAVPSERSRGVTLALAALLGPFGGHRFYVGKNGTGLLMLGTLGGCGLWVIFDLVMIIGGSIRDASGRLVSRWDPETAARHEPGVPDAVLRELDDLRTEVAELAERLDFAERLLARPQGTEPTDLPAPYR